MNEEYNDKLEKNTKYSNIYILFKIIVKEQSTKSP